MLQGFSVPLTPQGKSALVSPPPWHYSSDCIAIEYWADPAAIMALLPPGLAPDENSAGRAFLWFLDWQFTGSHDEVTDPARYQYREAFVLVEAVFERAPINYCTYIRLSEETWQHLSNAELLRAKCGRRPSCERKPVRRQCRGAWRAIGDGAFAARGEGH
jgi:hypothetical protein